MIKLLILYITMGVLTCMGLTLLFKEDIDRRGIKWLKGAIVIISMFWVIFLPYVIILSIYQKIIEIRRTKWKQNQRKKK